MGKRANTLKWSLDRLIKGNIEKPFTAKKKRGETVINKLEKLRLKILSDKIAYETEIAKFNESIAGVAHDLKTPIATIAGYAECIQDGIDDKDYAALISDKAAQMNEQVLSIVESVRTEKAEGLREYVEARSFFHGVVNDLRAAAEAKNIKLNISNIHKAYLYIDRKKIFRVLQNLVSNAVKATESGGKITLKLQIWGNYYYIRVIDNGCGIKKEDAEHIFEKFYMADKSRSGSNSGLGLYLAKEFVESHGGTIKFTSKPKKGSTFMFSLPIVPDNNKIPSTLRFEKKSLITKLVVVGIFGWIMCWIFRFVKVGETKCPSTLIAAFLSIPFFPFVWAIDFVSELVYHKIWFLAD